MRAGLHTASFRNEPNFSDAASPHGIAEARSHNPNHRLQMIQVAQSSGFENVVSLYTSALKWRLELTGKGSWPMNGGRRPTRTGPESAPPATVPVDDRRTFFDITGG